MKRLFVPEDNYFSTKVDGLKTDLNNKIPYQQYSSNLQDIGEASGSGQQTLSTNIDLNNYKLSDRMTLSMSNFIDFSFFSRYRDTWFTWVRVFVYVLLLIYNINQITKFLRGFNVADGSGASPYANNSNNNLKGGN